MVPRHPPGRRGTSGWPSPFMHLPNPRATPSHEPSDERTGSFCGFLGAQSAGTPAHKDSAAAHVDGPCDGDACTTASHHELLRCVAVRWPKLPSATPCLGADCVVGSAAWRPADSVTRCLHPGWPDAEPRHCCAGPLQSHHLLLITLFLVCRLNGSVSSRGDAKGIRSSRQSRAVPWS